MNRICTKGISSLPYRGGLKSCRVCERSACRYSRSSSVHSLPRRRAVSSCANRWWWGAERAFCRSSAATRSSGCWVMWDDDSSPYPSNANVISSSNGSFKKRVRCIASAVLLPDPAPHSVVPARLLLAIVCSLGRRSSKCWREIPDSKILLVSVGTLSSHSSIIMSPSTPTPFDPRRRASNVEESYMVPESCRRSNHDRQVSNASLSWTWIYASYHPTPWTLNT